MAERLILSVEAMIMAHVRDWLGGSALVLGATLGMSAAWGASPPFAVLPNDHTVRPAPNIPAPALHQTIKDPVFGTSVTRITDPVQLPGLTRIRHYYSKSDPFNADGTRAIMFGSNGSAWLYDAHTWKPIKQLRVGGSDPEIQWHPTDPNQFYFMGRAGNSRDVRGMYRYDIRSDSKTLLRDFSDYDVASGRNEGNMDKAGRYYALAGERNKEPVEAFVYDVVNDKVSRRIPVVRRMVSDWISVSPSGRFVVMMGKDRSRVYDIDMNHLRDLPEGSFGHGDICLLADGSEALVYDGADHQLDHNRNINIADLATGRVTIGVRIGWESTPHVSCRNLDLSGWALISTQGPDKKYPNHDFEIFWLKLDGSREVRRVAHHHSDRDDGGYFAEQHAVTNRDGSKIVFASNWQRRRVSSYLIDFSASRPAASSAAVRQP
jgi:hypothetical protein